MSQLKTLNNTQVGPRLIICPFCKKLTVRLDTVITSNGIAHKRLVCYNNACRMEKINVK